MKLGLFISDFEPDLQTLERLKIEKLGIFLVSDGIYNAFIKTNGAPSKVMEKKGAEYYALRTDFETRGFKEDKILKRVKPVDYDELVDLMMERYEKLAWL